MQQILKVLPVAAAFVLASSLGSFAQTGQGEVGPAGNHNGTHTSNPAYHQPAPRIVGPANGANHPTASSSQGDVGPAGTNNGSLTLNPKYRASQAKMKGPANGANHPTPSSSQGDVGPGGNNNGTLTGRTR